MVAVGDKLPEANFGIMGAEGPASASTNDIFAGKRVALFAVPGAFTPTCHKTHVPSFVAAADALSNKGIDSIVCVSVNDVFVLDAWAEATDAKGKITMLADDQAAFTQAIDMGLDLTARGLGMRSMRYSALIEDGTVQVLNVEDNPGQAVCTIGEALVDQV